MLVLTRPLRLSSVSSQSHIEQKTAEHAQGNEDNRNKSAIGAVSAPYSFLLQPIVRIERQRPRTQCQQKTNNSSCHDTRPSNVNGQPYTARQALLTLVALWLCLFTQSSSLANVANSSLCFDTTEDNGAVGVSKSEHAACYKQVASHQRLATVLVSHIVCCRLYGQGQRA